MHCFPPESKSSSLGAGGWSGAGRDPQSQEQNEKEAYGFSLRCVLVHELDAQIIVLGFSQVQYLFLSDCTSLVS